jgi:hypothetical protein
MLLHGASDLYDGSLIARTQHVIVVTVNYRLGAFGFLFDDENAPAENDELPGFQWGAEQMIITAATFGAQHQCQFWDAYPAALG